MGNAMIKEWFENKLAKQMNLPNLYSLDIFCKIKESEKAVYAMFYIGYNSTGTTARSKCSWIPKSCIENLESLKSIPVYEDALKLFHSEYDM